VVDGERPLKFHLKLQLFIKVVKDEVELIIYERFLPKKYLTVVKIQNFGQQMITGIDLKKRLFLVDRTDKEG
jgi:hypothetical protein